MKKTVSCKHLAVLTLVVLLSLLASALALPGVGPAPRPPAVRVSGPFVSNNLSLFLIHGKDQIKGAKFLTLDEALKQKQVVVHETSDVNNLAVENLSGYVVFIQSGDIVKGGKQDRTMQYDMLIPPRSGKVPLPAFCVEQGRWSQRGSEVVSSFSSAGGIASGRALKLAAKKEGSQHQVWSEVASAQEKLSSNLGASVRATRSPTSYELTMEQINVKQATNAHLRKLSGVIEGKSDVVGYAFAINGKLNSADVYASNELFRKLWPRLLKSTAVEAVAEEQKGKSFKAPAASEVMRFLSDAEGKPERQKVASKDSTMTEQEGKGAYAYKTRWYSAPREAQIIDSAPVLHSNYLAK